MSLEPRPVWTPLHSCSIVCWKKNQYRIRKRLNRAHCCAIDPKVLIGQTLFIELYGLVKHSAHENSETTQTDTLQPKTPPLKGNKQPRPITQVVVFQVGICFNGFLFCGGGRTVCTPSPHQTGFNKISTIWKPLPPLPARQNMHEINQPTTPQEDSISSSMPVSASYLQAVWKRQSPALPHTFAGMFSASEWRPPDLRTQQYPDTTTP